MRVVIADDEVLLRDGLARLLDGRRVRGRRHGGDAEELLRGSRCARPDVAIVDIRMPPTHTDEGLVAAAGDPRAASRVGVLVLSHYLESRYAMRLLERAPERAGYLLKDRVSDLAVLDRRARAHDEGECVVDPTIVCRLLRRPRDPDRSRTSPSASARCSA